MHLAGYYGPGGFMRMKGYPQRDYPKKGLVNPETAKKLWDVSEEMTGLKYKIS